MQAPDPIEAALARLMPAAMSASGQRSIEDMLDGLATELPESLAPVPTVRPAVMVKAKSAQAARTVRFGYPLIGLATAAALAAIFTVPALINPDPVKSIRAGVHGGISNVGITSTEADDVQWVSESSRVESAADEGWVSDNNGSAMQAVRVKMVGEDTYRDKETGYTVRVSEPREVLLLTPVSSF